MLTQAYQVRSSVSKDQKFTALLMYVFLLYNARQQVYQSFKFIYLVMSPASFFFFPANPSQILCVFQENCTKQKVPLLQELSVLKPVVWHLQEVLFFGIVKKPKFEFFCLILMLATLGLTE